MRGWLPQSRFLHSQVLLNSTCLEHYLPLQTFIHVDFPSPAVSRVCSRQGGWMMISSGLRAQALVAGGGASVHDHKNL